MLQLSFESLQPKQEIARLRKDPITHAQLVRYAGASGDFNPIHNDETFARSQGLDGTIAHGMLIMGMLGQLVSSFTDPTLVSAIEVKFANMTKPGEALVLSATVKKLQSEDRSAVIFLQAEGPSGDVKAKGDVVVRCS